MDHSPTIPQRTETQNSPGSAAVVLIRCARRWCAPWKSSRSLHDRSGTTVEPQRPPL